MFVLLHTDYIMTSSQQTEGPLETRTDEGEQAAQQPTTSEEAATSPQPIEDQGIDHPGI